LVFVSIDINTETNDFEERWHVNPNKFNKLSWIKLHDSINKITNIKLKVCLFC